MLDVLATLNVLELVVLVLYFSMLLFIFFYSIIQLFLVLSYLNAGDTNRSSAEIIEDWPRVTVQLPVYNERYVIERLIDNIATLDYPSDKLQIQVLDDSTDDTSELADKRAAHWRKTGLDIECVRRTDRTGFKAGALAHGLTLSKGELIAIFDADFVPPANFLKETVHRFQNPQLGVVQTRWKHLNENNNLLTKLQAFGLDAHFTVEQGGRYAANCFINFNGTAGIWRKRCIEDSGGWSSDTLTEDLDLSYRAQLKGWKFEYDENVGAPAELPEIMSALRTQQYRWTKGAAECTVKNLGKVLHNRSLPFVTKLNALFHLMNSFIFICVLGVSLLSIPVLFIKQQLVIHPALLGGASLFLFSLLALMTFYLVSHRKAHPEERFLKFIVRFVMFLSMSMGMSLHNAIAVFEGYVGRKTPFVRTPKFNLEQDDVSWKRNVYLVKSIPTLSIIELCLGALFLWAAYQGLLFADTGLMPFHILLGFGFGMVGFFGVKHAFKW